MGRAQRCSSGMALGLMGAIHPPRTWVWALAIDSWVQLMGFALNPAGFHLVSLLALAFATVVPTRVPC
jgi:hypothetical protein